MTAPNPWKVLLQNIEMRFGPTPMTVTIAWPSGFLVVGALARRKPSAVGVYSAHLSIRASLVR